MRTVDTDHLDKNERKTTVGLGKTLHGIKLSTMPTSRYSVAHSNSDRILTLEKPPVSPNRLTLGDLSTPQSPKNLISFPPALLNFEPAPTPQKRRRHVNPGLRRRKKLRQDQADGGASINALLWSPGPQIDPLHNDEEAENFFVDVAPSGGNTLANVEDQCYPEFLDSALSAAIGFVRLTNSIFAVQGWDGRAGVGTVSHLIRKFKC